MGGMWKLTMTVALLITALLPMMASVSPEAATPPREAALPVVIAQPLAAMDGGPLIAMPRGESTPTLPESGMLILVGSALFGLAALVRRTT